jgi:hypothetical protein
LEFQRLKLSRRKAIKSGVSADVSEELAAPFSSDFYAIDTL